MTSDTKELELKIREHVAHQEGRIERLTSALTALLDAQNGAPLIRNAEDYQSAVDYAHSVLSEESR